MTTLGFENYSDALKIYLTKYREVRRDLLAFPDYTNSDPTAF